MPGSTKELDPRVGERKTTLPPPPPPASKLRSRALAGFDRALTFAEAGLVKGPKVQLGTGAAGVGILVDNNQVAAARPGTGAAE